MDKQALTNTLLDQRGYFFAPKQLIPRDIDLTPYLKTGLVTVVSGIRRCGKSSLLSLIREALALPAERCLYCNFDDERLHEFTPEDFDTLYQIHLEWFRPERPQEIVFFLDEIQEKAQWERFLSRMYEQGFKIFVTGSSASLLSSEIATALTGRNLTLHLQPFSFREFLRFGNRLPDMDRMTTKDRAETTASFQDYLEWGGFPLMVAERNREIISSYYRDILYRDIIARHTLSRTDAIRELGLYLFSNTGKLFSIKSLQEITGVTSSDTIKRFLDYFEASYITSYIRKYDHSVKKQILNPRKVYAADTAFSRHLGFRFSEDRGRHLENIVYNELERRHGREGIFYHKGKKECDFILVSGRTVVFALQVTLSLHDPVTRRREMEGLLEAMDAYSLKEGLILTEDEEEKLTVDDQRIRILPLWRWLLEHNGK